MEAALAKPQLLPGVCPRCCKHSSPGSYARVCSIWDIFAISRAGIIAPAFRPAEGQTMATGTRPKPPKEPIAKNPKPIAKTLFQKLGPGLITGASDDDPSGIATYSQVGAQFGYGMLWTMVFSYPLMAAIQEISARIGRVTGCGIAANLRNKYPRW